MTWLIYNTKPTTGELFVGALVVCSTGLFLWRLFTTERKT